MFTVCTNCKTKFRVTSAQLKAAQGQVRCGNCHEVFDAFWALEGSAPRAEQAPAEEPPTTPNLDSVSARATAAPELDTIIRAGDEPPTDAPALKAGPRKAKLPPIGDLFGDLGHLPHVKAPIKPEPVTAAAQEDHTTPEPQGNVEFSIPATHHADDLPQHPAPRPRQRFAALWWLGIAIMLLVLLLQLVNANRAALAENPVLGPSLTALYSVLGRPLPPPRSVSAWDVSGLNVTSDPQAPGVLSITGALENQAGYRQPWPLLRVELTDRFGQALRGRDFKPGEYLSGAQADVMLSPGQAARFRIDIADPGADAVGFTLAPCLDLSGGRVCSVSERD